jgi:hypothetical protein
VLHFTEVSLKEEVVGQMVQYHRISRISRISPENLLSFCLIE